MSYLVPAPCSHVDFVPSAPAAASNDDSAHSIGVGCAAARDRRVLVSAALAAITGARERECREPHGRFRLLAVVGQGPTSVVFLADADDLRPHGKLALRLFRRRVEQATERTRFRHACDALQAIKHPQLAQFIAADWTDAHEPFLITEFLHGTPIVRHAAALQLDIAGRVSLMIGACAAMAALHRRGIAHGHLAAGKLMVDATGYVRIRDYGVAWLFMEERSASVGARGSDTAVAHSPPFVRAGGKEAMADDVFALGAVLHQLLLGDSPMSPCRRDTHPGTLDTSADLWLLAAPPSILRCALHAGLGDILAKATALNPAARYRDAAALASDLVRFLVTQV